MKFTIKRKDVEGGAIELDRSAWSGRVQARVDGKVLERLKENGRPFDLVTTNKQHHKLLVRARWLDPVPVVHIDAEEIPLAEKLRIIDYIFGCFPILMFLVYGAFSTVVGFFVLMGNFRILRTKLSPSVKWFAIYAMDLVVYVIVTAVINLVISVLK